MEKKDELETFLDKYLLKGFGSMNKNDFEVFIFSRLLISRYSALNDYQISTKLGIPISKVKRLRYEADLKYPSHKDYKTLFVEAMKGARYDNEKPVVVFSIENITLRQYLREVLMQRGNFYDSSFNSDIVKVSDKDFMCLLEDICLSDDEIKKDIKSTIKKKSEKDIPHLIVQAVASVAKNVGGNALSELTNIGLDKLIPVIKSLFIK